MLIQIIFYPLSNDIYLFLCPKRVGQIPLCIFLHAAKSYVTYICHFNNPVADLVLNFSYIQWLIAIQSRIYWYTGLGSMRDTIDAILIILYNLNSRFTEVLL